MIHGVTVLIPVLNEADIIEDNTTRLIDFLDGMASPFEVILVSNGSTDQTPDLGRKLAQSNKHIRFFNLPTRGVGRAFALGVREACFDNIVSLDMDLSIELELIPRALKLLDRYQVVVGSKKLGAQRRSFWRKAGSTIYIRTVRILLGLSFKDYSIAAKAYQRQAILDHLHRLDHGTSFVLDIIYHTLSGGGLAVEIPVYCEDFRPSKFNLIHEAVYRFDHLIRLWWKYRRRDFP